MTTVLLILAGFFVLAAGVATEIGKQKLRKRMIHKPLGSQGQSLQSASELKDKSFRQQDRAIRMIDVWISTSKPHEREPHWYSTIEGSKESAPKNRFFVPVKQYHPTKNAN